VTATGFEYERPTSLTEAMQLLADWGERARLLAGGTDLAVALRHGGASPQMIVDVKGVGELAPRIEVADGKYAFSANTVMTDLERDEQIRGRLRGLVEAAQVVGSVQIRNRATLTGNICNASPAADTPPVLMALDAILTVTGPHGSREMALDDFLVGYRRTALNVGELLTTVTVPEPGPRSGTAFLKLGVRRAMEISIVCVGARVVLAEDGTVASAGLGLGSVAPTTIRPRRAEQLLLGESPTPELFEAAGLAAGEVVSPIDDLRASAEYRRAMVPVLVARALATAAKRALEGS
jgi:carbon-monoxide dehydrogenase medium subunit